jgi:hypothetical protein
MLLVCASSGCQTPAASRSPVRVLFLLLKATPYSNHDLYAIGRTAMAPAAWAKASGIACAGRNELPTQKGITIEEAKAWCQGSAACVSFERLPTAGSFQFSSSCALRHAKSYPQHALYMIDRHSSGATSVASPCRPSAVPSSHTELRIESNRKLRKPKEEPGFTTCHRLAPCNSLWLVACGLWRHVAPALANGLHTGGGRCGGLRETARAREVALRGGVKGLCMA